MLRKLSHHISNCLERAAVAERQAADAANRDTKQDFERVAKNWRVLAASYQFSESLDQYVKTRAQRSPPDEPRSH